MTTQKTIPFKEFQKDQLASREVIRANSKRDNEEIIRIPLSQVVIRESAKEGRFNVRDLANYGDLNELAISIRKNGQIQPGRVTALASELNMCDTPVKHYIESFSRII